MGIHLEEGKKLRLIFHASSCLLVSTLHTHTLFHMTAPKAHGDDRQTADEKGIEERGVDPGDMRTNTRRHTHTCDFAMEAKCFEIVWFFFYKGLILYQS